MADRVIKTDLYKLRKVTGRVGEEIEINDDSRSITDRRITLYDIVGDDGNNYHLGIFGHTSAISPGVRGVFEYDPTDLVFLERATLEDDSSGEMVFERRVREYFHITSFDRETPTRKQYTNY